MKTNYIFLSLMFLMIGNTSYAQEKKIISVSVEYEHFLTESIDIVDCASFRTAFNNSIHNKRFTDCLSLKKLEHLKRDFVKKRKKNLNIRGTITFDYEGNKVKYCFDRYGYFERDGLIFSNKKLLDFLNKEIHFW